MTSGELGTDPNPPLTLVSWNLAMLERSAEAPGSVHHDMIENAVREFTLELAPDVVCWQELPNKVPFVETLDLMQATTRSHSGRLATLIAKDSALAACEPTIEAVDGVGLLSTFPEHDGRPAFTVGNVHLEPGKGGAGRRLEQLGELVSKSPTERLLVVGDTNMRLADVEFVVSAGFDAPKPSRPTWNSKKNHFRTDGHEFTAYFTRMFASPGVEITKTVVHDKPTTIDGTTFYWSDHFAVSATITIPSETPAS